MNYSNEMWEQAGMRPVAAESPDVRSVFMGKVYLTMGLGLLIAACMTFATFSYQPLFEAVIGLMRLWPLYVITIMALTWVVQTTSRTPVVNLITYGLYTGFMGCVTAPIIAIALMRSGDPAILFQALGLTGLLFTGLTIWALTTKDDLSRWGTYLFIGVLIMFGIGVIGMLTGFTIGLWWSAIMVVLMAGYIMYDTQMIQRNYSVEDVIPAGVALFTDFIVMFWNILRLLSRR